MAFKVAIFPGKFRKFTTAKAVAERSPQAPVTAAAFLAASNSQDFYSRVPRRSLVEVEGQDAVKFLQGLCTNHMPKIERGGDGMYSAFLTAQGRILYDSFIYPKNKGTEFPHPSFVVEVDSGAVNSFVSHLKRFVLRNKVTVRRKDECGVFQVWGPNAAQLWETYVEPVAASKMPAGSVVPKRFWDVGTRDSRHPELGLRMVVKNDVKFPVPPQFSDAGEETYVLRRLLYGIPEGEQDFFSGLSLPLESNLDCMNGVDFRKGCYLGQELTIRTYHTGVTRKRIVPVQLFREGDPVPDVCTWDPTFKDPLPPSQSEIRISGAPTTGGRRSNEAGKFCSGINNVGLALMRLDQLDSGSLVCEGGLRAKPFVPSWWPHPVPASS
ncbi:hypothetical protein BJ742DRAFT_858726 [Cladochytrium replicatum]|nr:hypothetical protein BJ742DRAFT_858726 [Cladochytrium replicatum]